MTFDEWLQHGIEQQWVLPPTCYTHDGIPMNEQEQEAFERGYDPCLHVARVCDPTEWLEIYDNTPAMQWRNSK